VVTVEPAAWAVGWMPVTKRIKINTAANNLVFMTPSIACFFDQFDK
jgi:hypothetical protein